MGTTRETAIGSTWAAAAWVFVAAAVAVVVVGMSNLYPRPDALRIESFAKLYRQLGLSDSLMITVFLVLPFSFAVVSACAILSRRSHDRSSVFLAVGLVAVYLFFSGAIVGIGVALVRNLLASITVVTIVWFLVGFPTASIVPRWGKSAPLAAIVVAILDPSFDARLREMLTDPTRSGSGGAAAILLAIFGVSIAAQVTRYRHHSTRSEQYQTRWVFAGLMLMLVPAPIVIGLSASGTSFGFAGWLVLASALGSFVLPAAVFVAVFRYHLYDLDRLVGRTVTYGLVAFVVGSAYALPVLLLPTLL